MGLREPARVARGGDPPMPGQKGTMSRPRPTILCLSSYEKGHEFMEEAHRLGSRIFFLTRDDLAD